MHVRLKSDIGLTLTKPIRVPFVETEQPIRSRKILLAVIETTVPLLGTQQGYQTGRIEHKIKIVHGGYLD